MLYGLILAGVAGAALFLLSRTLRADGRRALPKELRVAARNVGYDPGTAPDPVQCIENAALCIAALAHAFCEMSDASRVEGTAALERSLCKHLKLSTATARDMLALAPWLCAQSEGPTPAFDQLANRLKRLDHGPGFARLMSVLGDTAAAGSRGMPSARQADALGTLARIFRTA